MITLTYSQLTTKHDGSIYVSPAPPRLCVPFAERRPPGDLQGSVLRAHAETHRRRDSVPGPLCARVCVQARGHAHPEEVIVCVTRSRRQNNLNLVWDRTRARLRCMLRMIGLSIATWVMYCTGTDVMHPR